MQTEELRWFPKEKSNPDGAHSREGTQSCIGATSTKEGALRNTFRLHLEKHGMPKGSKKSDCLFYAEKDHPLVANGAGVRGPGGAAWSMCSR
jgi:hypothetical protein